MFRSTSIARAAAAVGGAAALLLAAPVVRAAPTDEVLAVPIAGLFNGATGLTGPPAIAYITARTDPDEPGVTRFRCDENPSTVCPVVVHWVNLSTGASGAADLWFGPSPKGEARTGSGRVAAVVTAGGVPGLLTPITLLPGAGVWSVP